MAVGGLIGLFDNIAALLDDVAAATKTAATKTVGIISDDLALNAQQVSGVRAERELPIVWGVAKGSLINKGIIIPLALIASQFAPWLISPVMLLGGLYLCFEGAEKIAEKLFNLEHDDNSSDSKENQDDPNFEKNKIKGAVRTDFVLSLEIIVLTLGTVAADSLATQAITLGIIGFLATVFVYELVAFIIRLDDMGFALIKGTQEKSVKRKLGMTLINSTPYMMKALAVIGTIAMVSVGGEIVVHHLDVAQQASAYMTGLANGLGIESVVAVLSHCVVGVIAGSVVLSIITMLGSAKKSVLSLVK